MAYPLCIYTRTLTYCIYYTQTGVSRSKLARSKRLMEWNHYSVIHNMNIFLSKREKFESVADATILTICLIFGPIIESLWFARNLASNCRLRLLVYWQNNRKFEYNLFSKVLGKHVDDVFFVQNALFYGHEMFGCVPAAAASVPPKRKLPFER